LRLDTVFFVRSTFFEKIMREIVISLGNLKR
jgi:hypothetical protein